MNGVEATDSNQECKIGYRNLNDGVSQCLTYTRKLGNRRSSEGLRSFTPSNGTNLITLLILAGDIEMNPSPRFQCRLCKKYCKASDKVIECEDCEMPRTSAIVQFIFYFYSFEISVNIVRNQK